MDSTCTASTLMNWFAAWEVREWRGGRGRVRRGGGMLLWLPGWMFVSLGQMSRKDTVRTDKTVMSRWGGVRRGGGMVAVVQF